MVFDLRFHFFLLMKRLPYVLAIMVVTTAAGVILAYTLPPVYRAEARLLVESPQIPDELAASTVRSTAEEILLGIEQRLVARNNLLDLANRFNLYAEVPDMLEDVRIEDMRRRIQITMPPFQRSTGLVIVSFDAAEPEQSALLTNALVEQILAQSIEVRTAASGGTLDFFQQEVKRLSEEMALQNAKILEFEQQNRSALPESLEYRRTRQSTQQERLLQVDRELAGLRDRRQRLADLYDRTGRLGPSLAPLTPEQARLETLRQELASALVMFSPENPRVRALRIQVAALEEAVREQTGGSEVDGLPNAFDLQVADLDGQIDFLAQQKGLLERELAEIDASIQATPANAIVLGGLRSDYDNLRVQYDQATQSLADARIGDRIEVTSRGQRITLIEDAAIPSAPAEPNRKLVVAAGLGAGLVLSSLLYFLLEVMNATVRRPAEMIGALDIVPFGAVPYLETRSEIRRHRIKLGLGLATAAIGLPAAIYYFDAYVFPLGDLMAIAAEKLGLPTLADRLRPGGLG
ncbi:MAG: GumC family protein [Paracoccaceae bacterium]